MTARRQTLVIAAALLLGAGALRAQAGRNPIPHEPLLVYQMSGGSGSSALLEILMVYDDGSITFVRQVDVGPAKVRRAVLGARTVQLVAALGRAGAMRLADHGARTADAPMTTVTAFSYAPKSGRPSVNTFSYYAPQGAYAQIDDAIHAFLTDAFGSY